MLRFWRGHAHMILACDPSCTAFGFALGGPEDAKPRAWTLKLPGADPYVLDKTFATAMDTVGLLCRSQKVTICAIEAPIIVMSRDSAAHTLAALVGLSAVVRAAAHRAGARVLLAASSTVRKHFVGHGRPDNPKRAVMDRCRLLGWDFTDDNAADAAATWCWAMSVSYPKWVPNGTPLFAGALA